MEDSLDRLGGPPPTRASWARARAELPRSPEALPGLPPAYHEALDRGLAALGITLGSEGLRAIDAHVRLLLAWNEAINLTAITDPAAIATRHVVDSLTAASVLADARSILDLGSGGGFPGLPLAVALPAARVTLVDSVAKKAAFLEVAIAAARLGERAAVRGARAEALGGAPSWDAVVARAVAGLAELVELAMPLLRVGGRLVAWKRGDLTDELAAGTRAAEALGAAPPIVRPAVPGGSIESLADHVLVEVRKARPTPPGHPRNPAARRRRPW